MLRERGDHVRSGTSNAGDVFELRAIRPAAESALRRRRSGSCRTPSRSKAPFVRLADRYAIFFLPVTIVVAGFAWAHLGRSGARPRRVRRRDALPADPRRSGRARLRDLTRREGGRDRQGRRRHRAARQGPHRAPRQDGHAHARDPRGRPGRRLRRDGPAELVRLAASLDQLSAHPLAEALVHHAISAGPVALVPGT